MDPFVATIVKKSALILGGFALVGLAVAVLYGLTQYQSLQHDDPHDGATSDLLKALQLKTALPPAATRPLPSTAS